MCNSNDSFIFFSLAAAAAAGRLRIFFVVRQSAERCANERRETSEHTHTQVYKEGRKERESI